MADIIKPKVLKGFRDSLPGNELCKKKLIRILEDHFSSFGYLPIDTPVLEYAEILLSKGGGESEKQSYRFTDHGGRDVALRFDLTVPFARFIATHRNEITMPFKRYHIAKAWRGENTQRGRYREFIQCDFDIVGSNSVAADLEIMIMMHSGLRALGAGESRIRFSHRALFNVFLDKLGLSGQTAGILRIVDKAGKIGWEEVRRQLREIAGPERSQDMIDFITPTGSNRQTLEKNLSMAGAEAEAAAHRVRAILDAVEELQLDQGFTLDPSITRGLDYYTGIVFETFLDDLPSLGSVCSGGRYDNLTGLFMKEALSGVGASFGLDRLMTGLEEIGRIDLRASSTDILVLMLDEDLHTVYQGLARDFRSTGLSVEVYPEAKKIAAQFKYAEAGKIPLALIVGQQELDAGVVNLKDLNKRESYKGLQQDQACKKALELLGR